MIKVMTDLASPPFITLGWILLLVVIGRFVSRHDRLRVYEIIQIFSYSFVLFALIIFGSVRLGLVSEAGVPEGRVGELVLEVFADELKIKFGPAVFGSGCILLFLPPLISCVLGALLNCLPLNGREVGDADTAAFTGTAKLEIEVSIETPNWLRKAATWLDPFHLLSLFLIKCLIGCAAALAALGLGQLFYGWGKAPGHNALIVVGSTAAVLTTAIVTSFGLDATQSVLLNRGVRTTLIRDTRSWIGRLVSKQVRGRTTRS